MKEAICKYCGQTFKRRSEKVTTCKNCKPIVKKYSMLLTDNQIKTYILTRTLSKNVKATLKDTYSCINCKRQLRKEDFPLITTKRGIKNKERICRFCIDSKKALEDKRRFISESELNKFIGVLYTNANRRAIECGMDFDLTLESLLSLYNNQRGLCAVSGLEMTWEETKETRTLTNISIDRIDSNKGYTLSNIQLVCVGINYMKCNVDNEIFLNFFNKIIQKNKG